MAGNTAPSGPDLTSDETIATTGVNLIGNTAGSTLSAGPNVIVNPAPSLAPLGNYGGPTQTRPPLPGSPAINAGSNAAATGLTADQRGNGFPRIVATTVDIGAVESGSANPALTVNTFADEGDGLGTGGTSLRDAIDFAPAGSTIVFDPMVFTTPRIITLATAPIALTKNVTIDATALPGGLTVRRDTTNPSAFRIFDVAASTTVGLKAFTVTGGRGDQGGALQNNGTLTLTGMTFTGNTATSNGGAIFNTGTGTVTAANCLFTTNATTGAGGGVFNQGTLTAADTSSGIIS